MEVNKSNWGPETWGDMVAPVYDEWFGGQSPEAAVDFLATLAGTGTALELGIGTGRVALPLAERGVEVQGIDAFRRTICWRPMTATTMTSRMTLARPSRRTLRRVQFEETAVAATTADASSHPTRASGLPTARD
jgi:hypothetical protein